VQLFLISVEAPITLAVGPPAGFKQVTKPVNYVWGVLLIAVAISAVLRGVYTHQMVESGLHEWNMTVNSDMWRHHHAASFLLDYANIDAHPSYRGGVYAEPRPAEGDLGWYDDQGRCVQSPAFNFALSGVYRVAAFFLHPRGQVLVAVLLNHALGALTIVLVFLFARKVWSGEAAALAALLMALHVPLVFLSGFVIRTSLGVFLIAAWLLQVARALERPTLVRWALCGVLAALAGLVRENLILLGPYAALLALLLTGRSWKWRRRIAAAAIVTGSFLITCAPVSVYNTWRAGEPTFVRRVPTVVWRHANSAVSWRQDAKFRTGTVRGWEHPALPVHSADFWALQARKFRVLTANDHIPNAAPWKLFAELCPVLRFRPVRFGHLFAFGCAGVLALLLWDRRGLWTLPLAGIMVVIIVLFGPHSRLRVVLVPLLAVVGSAGLVAATWHASTLRRRVVYLAVVIALIAAQAFTQVHRIPKAQDWYVLARLRQRQGDVDAALEACRRADQIERLPMTLFLRKQLLEQQEQRPD
jgi:hypothetical protein